MSTPDRLQEKPGPEQARRIKSRRAEIDEIWEAIGRIEDMLCGQAARRP